MSECTGAQLTSMWKCSREIRDKMLIEFVYISSHLPQIKLSNMYGISLIVVDMKLINNYPAAKLSTRARVPQMEAISTAIKV